MAVRLPNMAVRLPNMAVHLPNMAVQAGGGPRRLRYGWRRRHGRPCAQLPRGRVLRCRRRGPQRAAHRVERRRREQERTEVARHDFPRR